MSVEKPSPWDAAYPRSLGVARTTSWILRSVPFATKASVGCSPYFVPIDIVRHITEGDGASF